MLINEIKRILNNDIKGLNLAELNELFDEIYTEFQRHHIDLKLNLDDSGKYFKTLLYKEKNDYIIVEGTTNDTYGVHNVYLVKLMIKQNKKITYYIFDGINEVSQIIYKNKFKELLSNINKIYHINLK